MVATLSGCPSGQNVTFKVYEKDPMLTTTGRELVMLKDGAELTQVTTISQGTYAVVEVELRPKKDQKSSPTDTSPSLELWQEKFKHTTGTPEKFDYLWLEVSAPAKNSPKKFLQGSGEALKVKNQCFNVDKFIEEYKKIHTIWDQETHSYIRQTLKQKSILGLEHLLVDLKSYYAQKGICNLYYIAYMLATVKLETYDYIHQILFNPIAELGGDHYAQEMYDPVLGKNGNRRAIAVSLGNTVQGDGVKYKGRAEKISIFRILYIFRQHK